MKIGIYNFGNWDVAFRGVSNYLNLSLVTPTRSKESVDFGEKHCPEFCCTPYKILLGDYKNTLDKGATHLFGFSPQSIRTCQLSNFTTSHNLILKNLGYGFVMIHKADLSLKGLKKIVREVDPKISTLKILKALHLYLYQVSNVEILEDIYGKIYVSGGEKQAERYWNENVKIIEEEHRLRKQKKLRKGFYKKTLELNEDIKCNIKIVLLGDIFTVNEPLSNNDIVEKLLKKGVYVQRSSRYTDILSERFQKSEKPKLKKRVKIYKKFMKREVGGFSFCSIADAIGLAEKKYDGIIQVLPLTCGPETVVMNMLPKIGEKYDIPVMSIPVGEQTGDTNFDTRVEAFVDLLKFNKK